MDTETAGSRAADEVPEEATAAPVDGRSRRVDWLILVGVVVTPIVAARVLDHAWPHFPPTFSDSRSYVRVARGGPFAGHFFFDERPMLYPLLIWAVHFNSGAVVAAQTAIYIAAWWTLCRVVVRDLGVGLIGIGVVILLAAIAIEPRNSMWNTLILSESLSTSLAVFGIAAWWEFAMRNSARALVWAWFVTTLWVLVRDTNALPALVVIVPAALVTAVATRRGSRSTYRGLAAGAIALVLACCYVYASESVSGRTQNSMHNTIGDRVLPDPELLSYFTAAGMPLDDALRAQAHRDAWDGDAAFQNAPQLARYRAWAKGTGSRRLLESMVVLAPYWWRHLHHDLPTVLDDDAVLRQIYDYYHVYDRLPHAFPAPLGEPTTTTGLWVELALAIAGLGIAVTEVRWRRLVLLLAVGLLSSAVDVWVSYAGDPLEVGRHLVGPFARLSVFAVLSVAIGADVLMRRVRAARDTSGDLAPAGQGSS
jgi:hypothetical protein